VAAGPVDDPLVVGGGVSDTDSGVHLGAQRINTVGEVARQNSETEGAEVVDLSGGEHRVPPEDGYRGDSG
jgi:hypothetical protein